MLLWGLREGDGSFSVFVEEDAEEGLGAAGVGDDLMGEEEGVGGRVLDGCVSGS